VEFIYRFGREGKKCVQNYDDGPLGKRPLRRPGRKWGDNIKMDLREIGSEDEKWMERISGVEDSVSSTIGLLTNSLHGAASLRS
jgi:hypothetical protein